MTELPQTPPVPETVPRKTKPPRINPFDAHITFATPLRAVPGGMELQLSGESVIVATGFNSFPVGPREEIEGLPIQNGGVRLAFPEQEVTSDFVI
jgi:hypothetical protein